MQPTSNSTSLQNNALSSQLQNLCPSSRLLSPDNPFPASANYRINTTFADRITLINWIVAKNLNLENLSFLKNECFIIKESNALKSKKTEYKSLVYANVDKLIELIDSKMNEKQREIENQQNDQARQQEFNASIHHQTIGRGDSSSSSSSSNSINNSRISSNVINGVNNGSSSSSTSDLGSNPTSPDDDSTSEEDEDNNYYDNGQHEGRLVVQKTVSRQDVHGVPNNPPINPLEQIDQETRNFIERVCTIIDCPNPARDALDNTLGLLKSLMKAYSESTSSMTKKVAIRIAKIYSEKKYGINDLKSAAEYYEIASELGSKKSKACLALIALEQGDVDKHIAIIKNVIKLPEDIFTNAPLDLDVDIPPMQEKEKLFFHRMLRLLAAAYHRKNEYFVANRLIDISATIGDILLYEKIKQKISNDFNMKITQIFNLRSGFHLVLLNSMQPKAHEICPGEYEINKLVEEISKRGFYKYSVILKKQLMEALNANSALSRYFCYKNNQCTEGDDCAAQGIELCTTILARVPHHYLAAWVKAAFLKITQPTNQEEINQLANIAQTGGFSDPRSQSYPAPPVNSSLASVPPSSDASLFEGLGSITFEHFLE